MTAGQEEISRSAHAAARSGLYRLLSALFRSEPAAALVNQLRQAEFRDALAGAGVILPDDFYTSPGKEYLTELEMEYARLFIGPGSHISPHESVHREDEESGLYGRATVKVRQFLETAGFTLQPDYNGLPDHISVELELMQVLAGYEAGAWDRNETELAMTCLELEKDFISQHLIRWIPAFCIKIIEEAEHPFYREIAKLMNDFIEMEADTISMSKTGLQWNRSEGASARP